MYFSMYSIYIKKQLPTGMQQMQRRLPDIDAIIEVHDARISFT